MPTAAGLHFFFNGGSMLKVPLVLVHGAGTNHLIWPAEVRHLPEHRVYTLDLPGHGKSRGAGRQSIQDYAGDVAKFMDGAGLSRAVIVGHGMGGAIALALALDYPHYVAGIGLFSTGACLPVPALMLENAASQSTLPQTIKQWLEMSLGPQTPAAVKEILIKQLSGTRQSLLMGDLLACSRMDLTERLETIRTPALVACGMQDRLTPLYFSELLSRKIRGAALQTVDGAGHLLILEQPHRVAKLISVFLGTVPYMPGM